MGMEKHKILLVEDERDIFKNDAVIGDTNVIGNLHWAENLGAGADRDAVANCWMALTCCEASSSQSDVVIEHDIVANFSCFSNNNADAVINKESLTDDRGRMNLDSCATPSAI